MDIQYTLNSFYNYLYTYTKLSIRDYTGIFNYSAYAYYIVDK